jgi:hypothetical protein
MCFLDRTLLTQTEAQSLKLNGNITETPLLAGKTSEATKP